MSGDARAFPWRAAGVAALCLAAGAAAAQQPQRAARLPLYAPSAAQAVRPLSPLQRQERGFLREAAASLRLQAQAAQLAQERGVDPAVREFASAVLKDQRQREAELLRLLHARGMAQPMLDNAQARTLAALGRGSGRKFDQLYLEQVALRSRAAEIGAYERIAAATEDPALKRWVDRQLPAMRHQLLLAESAVPARSAARASATRSMGAARTAPVR
jgi:putative membrane protein